MKAHPSDNPIDQTAGHKAALQPKAMIVPFGSPSRGPLTGSREKPDRSGCGSACNGLFNGSPLTSVTQVGGRMILIK